VDLDLSDMDVTPVVTATIEGILEPEDLAALVSQGFDAQDLAVAAAPVDDPSDLKKLREKHHSVARLIAGGMAQSLCAAITGYTQPYISVLLKNPAMVELIEMYRIKNGAAAQVITENLRTVGSKATEKLNEMLDNGTVKDVHELVAIAKLGHDRSGHGPSSTSHNIQESHVIDHAKLALLNDEARKGSKEFIRSRASRTQPVIEHKPTEAADEGD